MTWSSALERGTDILRRGGVESPRREAEELLAYALKRSRAQVVAERRAMLSAVGARGFFGLIARRARRIPLQYLLGEEVFGELRLSVGPGVLIPRPETELLVSEALRCCGRDPIRRFVDLGTGSGNVALALARAHPAAQAAATDLSPAALRFARTNRRRLDIRNLKFFQGRVDAPLPAAWRGTCDLVVSNPPYIPRGELAGLQPEVRREPRLALDGGPDGLVSLRAVIEAARRLLRPGGVFACEIGIGQDRAVRALLAAGGFGEIGSLPDWNGIPRIISARLGRGTFS